MKKPKTAKGFSKLPTGLGPKGKTNPHATPKWMGRNKTGNVNYSKGSEGAKNSQK